MSSEDDTYRILSRRSFDDILSSIAEDCGIDRSKFHRQFESIVLGGSRPNEEFKNIWPGWTYDEVVKEVVKRKENDAGQEE